MNKTFKKGMYKTIISLLISSAVFFSSGTVAFASEINAPYESASTDYSSHRESNASNAADLKIITQPTNKTVKLGDNVTLSLRAQGIGLSYQWYFKKAGQTSWNVWKGRTRASETVTPNETWNGIQLYCKVTDAEGNSVNSNFIKITVTQDLKITTQPTNKTVKLGDNVTLSLKAQGIGLKYQWYYMKTGQTSWNILNGRTHASETFTPNETWNGIRLYCEIADANGNFVSSNVIKVTVTQELKIITQPKNVSTKANQLVNISVKATGNNLQYQWYYKKKGANEFSPWKGFTKATIQPPANNTWNGMQVRCLITDGSGNKLYTDIATVTLIPYADSDFQITTQPKSVSIEKASVGSQSVTFTVKTKNGSGLKYQWYYCMAGQSTFSEWSGRTSATETVRPNASWDGIQIYCKITNSKGESLYSDIAKVTFTATRLAITAQPSNKTVTLGNNATVSLQAKGEGLRYQWYYKKAGQTSWNVWNGRIHASETFTPNETWNGMQLYCKVTDSSANTVDSNIVKITVTQELKIISQPTNQTITLGDSTTVSLQAQGMGLKYQWYYKKAGQTSWSVMNGRTRASEIFTPNETWNGIQLYCEVSDSSGNLVVSNTVSVYVTDNFYISLQPTNKTVELNNSVTVSVTAQGTGLSYQWYYKKSGQSTFTLWNGRTHASETFTPNATWNGTQLYCRVQNSFGDVLKSNTITITVKEKNTVPIPTGTYVCVYSKSPSSEITASDWSYLVDIGSFILLDVYSDGTVEETYYTDYKVDDVFEYVFKGNDLYFEGSLKCYYNYSDGYLTISFTGNSGKFISIYGKLDD